MKMSLKMPFFAPGRNFRVDWVRLVLIGALTWAAPAAAFAGGARVATVPDAGGEWSIRLTPAGSLPPVETLAAHQVRITPQPARGIDAADDPANDTDAEPPAEALAAPLHPRLSYQEVYDSIPFNRAEYEANPSYRHEAAMELLFGQLRPMVVHKHAPPPPPAGMAPLPGIAPPWMTPAALFDFSRGPYSISPGLFGYRSGYRSKYHVYSGYLDLPTAWWW